MKTERLINYNLTQSQRTCLVIAILYINLKGLQGLQCLSCNAAVSPTDCDTVKLCGSHENCFMDVFVSDSGIIRYRLGCRDAQQCSTQNGKRSLFTEFQVTDPMEIHTVSNLYRETYPNASGSKQLKARANHRRSQDLLVCTNCCTDTLCNSAGCGNTGYEQPRGPVCFNCPQQRTTGDCDKITVCGTDQVCMLERLTSTVSHHELYQTRCEEETACSAKASFSLIGRRQVNAHCCKGELCNLDPFPTSASSVISVFTTTPVTINSPCISNPCARGTCTSYHDTYQCICETGFTGRNCDLFSPETSTSTSQSTTGLMACMSNPCAWGRCEPYQSTYICHCDHGYYGRNCDLSLPFSSETITSTTQSTTALVACMSNPCAWGKCEPYQSTYTCHCDHGYYGRNCDLYAGQITTTIMPTVESTTHVTTPLIQPTTTATLGFCQSNPAGPVICGYGSCVNSENGYTCECNDGYKGHNCLLNSHTCYGGLPCYHNGVCVLWLHCNCRFGYTGKHCELLNTTVPIFFSVGDVVVRGPNWNHGNEDGSGFGRVISKASKGGVNVSWLNGVSNYYENQPGVVVIKLI